jgi:nucleotide-binding universal stress UspA family protein
MIHTPIMEIMIMFQNILVASDGSDVSNRAVAVAIKLAAIVSAKLVFAFVTIPYTQAQAQYGATTLTHAEHEIANLETAHRIFAHVKKTAAQSKVVFRTLAVENDQIWRGILQVAKIEFCDLICMASHGRAGLSAVVLGSETQKVLTNAQVPVLVVR